MKSLLLSFAALYLCTLHTAAQPFSDEKPPRVAVENGLLEGVWQSGISIFKGIPFAAPPVGELRWKAPQPASNWEGMRMAKAFGPRPMQLPLFDDMMFRSPGISEDCLYLNVWTGAKTGREKLPVLVYFYGGGLMAGDGSELRYDGESMARRGIVTVTVNYRLSVFGFLAHPELSKESPHRASGNYGFLDQAKALEWVAKNIAAFGGDPKKITIAGESAGSFSVCAQMASPLSKNIIAGAIGESGSLLGWKTASLSEAEKTGQNFAEAVQAKNLAALRAMPADKLMEATKKDGFGRFPVTVDGYFFPTPPLEIFTAGAQAHVPLLVGWNTLEGSYQGILGNKEPTIANFTDAVKKRYTDHADEILKVYAPKTDAEVKQVATALASDQFIGFGTWKWADKQTQTGNSQVYRYLYGRPRPAMRSDNSAHPIIADGAAHSAEIEYAMGNLPTNKVYNWQPEDYRVSDIIQGYFENFIKTGNPNGLGLPAWPALKPGVNSFYMYIDAITAAREEDHRDRYLTMDKLMK